MKVVIMCEYDHPKDEERNEKRLKFLNEVAQPYWKNLVKEKDIKLEPSAWTDNTGHAVEWHKFETIEDFAKIWDDVSIQQNLARYSCFVDNMRIRVLRLLE